MAISVSVLVYFMHGSCMTYVIIIKIFCCKDDDVQDLVVCYENWAERGGGKGGTIQCKQTADREE